MSKQRRRQILARDLEALSAEFVQAVAADQAAQPCNCRNCQAKRGEPPTMPSVAPSLQMRANAMSVAMTLCLNGQIQADRVVPMAREVLRFLEGD